MTKRFGGLALAALVSLVGAACTDQVPVGHPPTVQEVLADSVQLAPGGVVVVGSLRLTFLEVSGDSRCPIDAVCIWEGNAAVEVAVGLGRGVSVRQTLHTSGPQTSVYHGGYRVTLLQLLPAPRASTPTPPDAYRASFRIVTLDE
jgi:hypothetical protein